jgi:hypothetical protein
VIESNTIHKLKLTPMPENNRSIGSEGLEQGGPNLGNDISRDDLSVRNAGDALTTPKSMGADDNNADDAELDTDLEDDELDNEIDLADDEDDDVDEDDDEKGL